MENIDAVFAQLLEQETGFSPVDGYERVTYSDENTIYIENKSIGDLQDQISVSGESNSQYIQFERDRYMDGIDLSDKRLQIHYERPDGSGDNSPAVNVEISENRLRYGWVIPGKAVEQPGILRIMPFAFAEESSDVYIMKELYAEYVIHDGLAIDGGIKEPDDEWYNQFLVQMQTLLNQSIAAKNSALESERNAAESAKNALLSQTKAEVSAAAASTHETNAQSAKDTAVTSAAQAKKYFENTQQLSMTNVGDVKISIDAERRCLVAQYMASDDEELSDDWYTKFLSQVSEWLTEIQGSALAAGNSEAAAEEYMENAQASASAAQSANLLAQQAKAESLSSSGLAQQAAQAAQTYYKQTKALSVSSIGNIEFGIDGKRKCLTATYNESDTVN